MPTFTDEQIDDFIGRWEQDCGERLSPDEARAQATKLLTLFRIVMRPLPAVEEAVVHPEHHTAPEGNAGSL